jgi:osmotically inducible protein OsmC
MPVRRASAEWRGDLANGTGTVSTESGAVKGSYSFPSRFESGEGTNPEELVGAAHAACFSMAFSNGLAKAGFTPESVRTEARVHLEKGEVGFSLTQIYLDCVAQVPGIDEATFQGLAEGAKNGCPISKALAATEIHLDVRLA